MKKFLFLLYGIFCITSHGMDFNTLLTKPKIPVKNIEPTAYGFPGEFQINLIEHKNTLSSKPTPYGNLGLYNHIPAIGFYQSPYLFTLRLALIELDPQMIEHGMPSSLKTALMKSLAPGKSFNDILATKTLYAHIMISGDIEGKKQYNLVFHPFGYSFMGKLLFNINMPMGVFDANGIEATSQGISFGSFQAQNVNAHNGKDFAFSPNNARISVPANRSVSTFWSAAYSPNKQFITITYHIMANNLQTQTAFEKFIRGATNIADLLNTMKTTEDTLANPNDRNALEETIKTINIILKWQEYQPAPSTAPTMTKPPATIQDLSKKLGQLSIILTKLEQQLATISK
jgi:hypothetical protein